MELVRFENGGEWRTLQDRNGAYLLLLFKDGDRQRRFKAIVERDESGEIYAKVKDCIAKKISEESKAPDTVDKNGRPLFVVEDNKRGKWPVEVQEVTAPNPA